MAVGSHLPTFSTTDLDEAVAVGSRMFYGHRILPAGRAAGFSYVATGAQLGSATLGLVGFGTGVTVEFGGLEGSYGVSLPTRGPLELHIGADEFIASPDAAAVVGPVGELRATGWGTADDRLAHLKFTRPMLETELSRMLGTDPVGEIRFPYLMDLRSGRGAEWARLARLLFASLESPDGLATNRLFIAQMTSALMTGLLLANAHQFRDALDRPALPVPPAIIRRAVDFIDQNAQQPITVPDIAAAVGASVRTLNRGFSDHLSTSPGAYLVRARLDGAHRELAAGHPDTTTVAQVSAAWGFFNQGRFATRYRAAYGVLPSQTLRDV